MTTIALTVPVIRRILGDRPIRAKLTAAITDTTTETFSTSAAHAALFAVGERWEHDDSTGELRDVTVVDTATPLITAIRGAGDSTAVTHSNSTYLIKEPFYTYDFLSQAINQCLDYDLYPDIYEIVEHQVTSNAAGTGNSYNAPTANCEQFLDVYQRTTSTAVPERSNILYTVYPQNVDTALWANGKMFEIYGGKQDGTEKFYVNCAHRIAIGTLLTRQERLVQMCAVKYALEWKNPRRLAGPANQGDRSIRPSDPLVSARYYDDLFRKMKRDEARWLKKQVPRRTVFVRGTVTYAHVD